MRDAQAHYPRIDASLTTIGGISMGGYGALKLLEDRPDLFGGGILLWPCIQGCNFADVNNYVDSDRNHQVLIDAGALDVFWLSELLADGQPVRGAPVPVRVLHVVVLRA